MKWRDERKSEKGHFDKLNKFGKHFSKFTDYKETGKFFSGDIFAFPGAWRETESIRGFQRGIVDSIFGFNKPKGNLSLQGNIPLNRSIRSEKHSLGTRVLDEPLLPNKKQRISEPSPSMQILNDEQQSAQLWRKPQYSRKSKRKHRKWVGFKNKVQAALDDVWKSKTAFFTERKSISVAAGVQGFGYVSCFGLSGETGTFNDLANLFTAMGIAATAETATMRINSCYLDLNIWSANANESVQVDVYEMTLKKQPPDAEGDDAIDTITNLVANDETMPSGTAPSVTMVGWTPFASPSLCQYFTVHSKQRIQLGTGQPVSLHRGYKPRARLSRLDVDQFNFKPYLTKFWFFIITGRSHGNPATDSKASHYPTVAVNIQVTRTYNIDLQDQTLNVAQTHAAIQADP